MDTSDFIINETGLLESFDSVAFSLFNAYELAVRNRRFRIVELEFYYYSAAHPDNKTLRRVCAAGEPWRHRFGFDICFASDDVSYGGVLIRSMKEVSPIGCRYAFINGPVNCFNHLIAIGGFHELALEKKKTVSSYAPFEPLKSERIVRKSAGNPYIESPYRYAVELVPENKLKRKEHLAFSLPEDVRHRFLGYKLRRR